jgi:hypothetical protein
MHLLFVPQDKSISNELSDGFGYGFGCSRMGMQLRSLYLEKTIEFFTRLF